MTKSRIAIITFEFIQPFLEGRGFFDFQTPQLVDNDIVLKLPRERYVTCDQREN